MHDYTLPSIRYTRTQVAVSIDSDKLSRIRLGSGGRFDRLGQAKSHPSRPHAIRCVLPVPSLDGTATLRVRRGSPILLRDSRYITPERKHYYPNVQPHRKMYSNNLEVAVSNYSAAHLIDGRIRLADDYFNFARALSNPRTTTSTIRLDYFNGQLTDGYFDHATTSADDYPDYSSRLEN